MLGTALPCLLCFKEASVIEPPRIVETSEQHTAVIHLTVTMQDMVRAIDPAIQEILAVLRGQDMAPSGPMFTYHFRRPTDTFDFEVGFPVRRPITPSGRVKPARLPAARVARTVHQGGYEGLPCAWGELDEWMKSEGLHQHATLWEVYLRGPESGQDSGNWRTELNRPVS